MRTALYLWVLILCGQACAAGVDSSDAELAGDSASEALKSNSKVIQHIDLLAGDLPSPLQEAQALQAAGGTFGIRTMRELSELGRANETDARPWLLLARDAVRTEIQIFAVRYYRMAIAADEVAAFQPQVFEDLIDVVRTAGGVELEEAQALILATYGLDGVSSRMDAAIAGARNARDIQGTERLEDLRDQLQSDPGSTSEGQ